MNGTVKLSRMFCVDSTLLCPLHCESAGRREMHMKTFELLLRHKLQLRVAPCGSGAKTSTTNHNILRLFLTCTSLSLISLMMLSVYTKQPKHFMY